MPTRSLTSRDGQNVGYGDGHAEFARLPNCGQSNDNIYTPGQPAGTPSPTGPGLASTGAVSLGQSGGSPGAWDVAMVPVSNAGAARN